MIAAALPTISSELSIDASVAMTYLIASYLIINLLFQVPSGYISDYYGSKNIIILGGMVIVFSSLLPFFSDNKNIIFISRNVLGLGGVLLTPALIAYVLSLRESKYVDNVMSTISSALGFSVAIGPVVGGFITNFAGWQYIFYINIPVYLFMIISIIFFNKGNLLRFENIKDKESFNVNSNYLSKVILAPKFLIGLVITFVYSMILYGMVSIIPFYISSRVGDDPTYVGFILFTMTFSMAIMSILQKKIKDLKINNAKMIVSFPVIILSITVLIYSDAVDLITVICCIFIGLSIGAVYGVSQSWIIRGGRGSARGVLAGVASTARYLGGGVGILIVVMLDKVSNEKDSMSFIYNSLYVYMAIVFTSFIFVFFLLKKIDFTEKL
ncbi:MFS transporter [Xenorhabdus bovienii]|nr:MFS transporter [Xenorhabdus bovienii]